MEAACGSVWAAAVGVCASLFLIYLVWKYHPSYGANPYCPSFPLVGCLPFVLLNKHRLYEWSCSVFDRSPSLTLRLNFGRTVGVSTADPQVIHHILKSNFPYYPKGPSFYPIFADLLGNGIFNCDGALWRFQRKVASHVFTSNSLRDFVVAIAETEIAGRLLPALDSTQGFSDGCVDLQALLMHYSFDTICQLTFGTDPGCLDSSKLKNIHVNIGKAASARVASADEDDAAYDGSVHTSIYSKVPDPLIQGFVQGFQVALEVTANRFLVPDFVWRTKRFLKIGSEKKFMDAMEEVHKFTSFVIEQSKREVASGKDRKDILARFIGLSRDVLESPVDIDATNREEEEGMVITDALLKDILLSFILAGREAIVSGVTFAMLLLCGHPRVEGEVLKEVEGILRDRYPKYGEGDETRVQATSSSFSYDELRRMNYLQAVLSESMRLYPPVPGNCKFAAEDDIFPDGTPVWKGNQVAYNVFAMGRARRVWGEDCLDFKPERWLGENGAFVPASPFKYPVFQAGPRICLGKDFAFIQMKLLVASLVRDFEFVLQPGFKPKLSYGVNLLLVNGLPLTPCKRRRPFLA